MRVLELSLRNYRVFEEVDLELPSRVIGIFGPNGAGKSTLVESIAFALYGVEATRTKKDGIRTHGVLTDCEVRLVFEHGGNQYELRRAIKGRGHAPDAELYVGGLVLATGTTEVTQEIVRLLHMDLAVFRASVYAEQKQLDALSDQTASKRKDMALRLLGIKPVDDARSAARKEARATATSVSQLAEAVVDIAALEAQVKEAHDVAAEARGSADAAAKDLEAAAAADEAAREAFATIDAVRQRVETLTVELTSATRQRDARTAERDERLARIERFEKDLAELPSLDDQLGSLEGIEDRAAAAAGAADLATRLASAESALGEMPVVDADAAIEAAAQAESQLADARDADTRARAEAERAIVALTEAEAHLARAREADPSLPCPTCGQALGDGFARYVKERTGAVATAKKALAAAKKEAGTSGKAVVAAERARAAAARAGDDVRTTVERRLRLEEQIEGMRSDLAAKLAPFDGEVPDADALAADATRARSLRERRAQLAVAEERLDEARGDLGRIDEQLAELGSTIERLTDEATSLAFDADTHREAAAAEGEAAAALDAARVRERQASDAAKEHEKTAERLEGQLTQARETAARVDELRSDARYLERTAMLLDGFRDHLVARVGPELSREAEALFRELTNHEYDDLRIHDDTLAIEIADGDMYFPITRFSGSETDLANLALRVAISTHLSRVSGADVG
ncbi:MAG TPA: SMC family ATPase, partial [Actinomycetota bacterium]|nr:SMC family ATPase [Actinomycetota bacterium]